jgi:molybdopterin synthase catalytic subunit
VIRIQTEDFDIAQEYQAMRIGNSQDGAIVFFVGCVRDFNQGNSVQSLMIEHYPAMTEKSLQKIVDKAQGQWRIGRIRLVHRVGELNMNDQIVFVAVSSIHREDAFQAAQFIMDYLKTQAPFWKKETLSSGKKHWVEANEKDTHAAGQWDV